MINDKDKQHILTLLGARDKELIWVTKEVAEKYFKMTSIDECEKIVIDAAKELYKEQTYAVEGLDEQVIMFKAKCITYKNAYKNIVNDITKDVEPLWEQLDKLRSKVGIEVAKTTLVLNEVKSTASELDKAFKSIDSGVTYKLEKIIEVVEKFNKMTSEDKVIITMLLKTDKMKDLV